MDEYLTNNTITLKYSGEPNKLFSGINNNFGDAINKFIFAYFTKRIIKLENCYIKANSYSILGIGSILKYSTPNCIVYGSGIIGDNHIPNQKPKKILVVRGPVTRNKLISIGWNDCPENYGDPVLLLPFIIQIPRIERKYKLGIIPHYIDKGSHLLNGLRENDDVLMIDILSANNPEKIINEICSCQQILSSSLHGIILSDAYNVPAHHLILSDKVVGGSFKFRDYYQSVNREYIPYKIDDSTTLDSMLMQLIPYRMILDLKKLIKLFPFIDEQVKNNCIKKLDDGYMNHIHNH